MSYNPLFCFVTSCDTHLMTLSSNIKNNNNEMTGKENGVTVKERGSNEQNAR